MAYCEILCIRAGTSHLDNALRYAAAREKTDIDREAPSGRQSESRRSLRHASCIGLSSPDAAAAEFQQTWDAFGKSGGRAAYHLIQSFDPHDEITPEQAQEIGRQMAAKLFPGHQALIGTHLDRDHIHNHIVINAVSSVDGHKAHFKKGFLDQQIRALSDDLCRAYGLKVTERSPDAAVQRKGSYRRTAKSDLEYALSLTGSRAFAVRQMRQYGYETEVDEKGYRVRPPGAKRWLRFTPDSLRIPQRSRWTIGPLRLHNRNMNVPDRGPRLTPFAARLLQYAVILGRQRTARDPGITVEQYNHASDALDTLRIMHSGAFFDAAGLNARLEYLKAEKRRLRRRKRQLQKSEDGEARERASEAALIGRQLDALEREEEVLMTAKSRKHEIGAVLHADKKRRGLAKWQRGRAEIPHLDSEDGIEEAAERERRAEAAGTKRREKGGMDR